MAGVGQEGTGQGANGVLTFRQGLEQRQGAIQQQWHLLNPATAPALSDPQAQRQAQLNLAENQQQQAGVSVQKRADQLRFELVRNTHLTLLIALAYLAGFRVLCGRSV